MSLNPKPDRLIAKGQPRALILHLTDVNEGDVLPHMAEATDYVYAAFGVGDWNADLSPWPAPPVFGREPFGGHARETLDLLLNAALPGLPALPVIIGGYSLSGLFALWAHCEAPDAFRAAVAASPSVWFPGWDDYADAHAPHGAVYLSLGKKEPHARNRQMATVGEAIVRQAARLEGIPSILEWNEGNHFTDPEGRTARGFVWALEHMES